jgi:hypothetical protein
MEKIEGGCLCGAVRFAITPPTLWCAHCHCSLCRRAHGAPYVTFVGVPRERFQLLAGEAELERYQSTPQATRGFCRRCGSTMLFESSRWADQVHVARAAIPGEIDRAPQAHCFYSDKASWVTVSDGLPLRGGPSGTEPL